MKRQRDCLPLIRLPPWKSARFCECLGTCSLTCSVREDLSWFLGGFVHLFVFVNERISLCVRWQTDAALAAPQWQTEQRHFLQLVHTAYQPNQQWLPCTHTHTRPRAHSHSTWAPRRWHFQLQSFYLVCIPLNRADLPARQLWVLEQTQSCSDSEALRWKWREQDAEQSRCKALNQKNESCFPVFSSRLTGSGMQTDQDEGWRTPYRNVRARITHPPPQQSCRGCNCYFTSASQLRIQKDRWAGLDLCIISASC